jgi:hypothetical protein
VFIQGILAKLPIQNLSFLLYEKQTIAADSAWNNCVFFLQKMYGMSNYF